MRASVAGDKPDEAGSARSLALVLLLLLLLLYRPSNYLVHADLVLVLGVAIDQHRPWSLVRAKSYQSKTLPHNLGT